MSLPIVADSNIAALQKIAVEDKAVFIATLTNGEKFVIKREQSVESEGIVSSQRWGTKLMRKAMDNDSVLKVKVLTSQEKDQFVRIVQRLRTTAGLESLKQQLYDDIVNPANNDLLWVKMPLNLCFGSDDFDFTVSKYLPSDIKITKTLEANEKKIKGYEAMDHHSFWKALGKILAIDMFNSNFDRFSCDGTLSNGGNVVLNTHSDLPLPIDAWNAAEFNSMLSDYTKSFINEIGPNKDKIVAGLNILRNENREGKTFAEAVIKDMLKKVGKADDDNMVNDFVKTYRDDFVTGLKEGKEKLKQVVRQKAAQYGGAGKTVTQIGLKLPSAFAAKLPGFQNAINQTKANAAIAPVGRSMPIGLVERAEFLGWL